MTAYKNVMELLVEQEVDRQLAALPAKVAAYVNKLELTAYALNQLPALYATSERGLEFQIRQGKSKYGAQIVQSVNRAIAAIRRDPIRSYAPLPNAQPPLLQEVLTQLRRVLKNDTLNWETLPNAVEQALVSATQPASNGPSLEAQPSPTGRRRSAVYGRQASSPFPEYPTASSGPVSAGSDRASRPQATPARNSATATPRVNPSPLPAQPQSDESPTPFGWDDFYR